MSNNILYGISGADEYFSSEDQFNVDDNLEQSSSNGYRDQNSEIDSYDYCSEFDFDQKSGIHLGIKPSQYVYPDSIISSDDVQSTNYQEEFDKYRFKKVISVSVLAGESCFELMNGQTVKIPRSKTLRFAEKTKLANSVLFSFLSFEDCDGFFGTLSNERVLDQFAEGVEQITFENYVSSNGFRHFVAANNGNLRELRLKNILLAGDDELSPKYNRRFNINMPRYGIKELILALMLKNAQKIKTLILDLRMTKTANYENPILYLNFGNIPSLDYLEIQSTESPNEKKFLGTERKLQNVLSKKGHAVFTFDDFHHDFVDILTNNGYYQIDDARHYVSGSETHKRRYKVYQHRDSQAEYHLLYNVKCKCCN